MAAWNVPDGLPESAFCQMEGCIGRGRCPRCGDINYHLMGFYGAVATAARRWGISQDEAEKRIRANQEARWDRAIEREALKKGLTLADAEESLLAKVP